MVKRRIYSFQMDGESRAEAILRAFQQYTLVDLTLYNKVSLQIVSSVKHPLLMGELSQLMSIGQSFMDSAQVEFHSITLFFFDVLSFHWYFRWMPDIKNLKLVTSP